MKKFLLLLFFTGLMQTIIVAQNIGINATGALPNASAMLDISATNKGMLVPRMNSTQRIAITTPAVGLLVFHNQTNSFWFYNGAAWTELSVGNNGWGLTGNTGINPATHFIGTTDEKPLRFKVNNTWAGEIHPTSFNVFLGMNAGVANTLGTSNTAVGEQSLAANTEGNFNTATGYNSLLANTTGFNNTAHGAYALYSNKTGRSNTAVGRNALFANTTGSYNTATGQDALLASITGDYNTANGYQSMYSNTTGGYNTANGYQSIYSNTTGGANTASGYKALGSNQVGSGNTAVGYQSLLANNGNANTAFGSETLLSNTTGENNTAFGYMALTFNRTGYYNTANGWHALQWNEVGTDNTATGSSALNKNEGHSNTATGSAALYSNTAGGGNTAIGVSALFFNTNGNYNTAIGYGAGNDVNSPNLSNCIGIGNNDLLNQAPNQVIIGNSSTVAIGGKVGWTTISDARVKNNITEEVKGLDFILKLRPVTYHIGVKAMNVVTGNKATPDFPGKYDSEKIQYTGFLAQEVEQAAKDARYDFSGVNPPKDQKQYYTLTYETFVVPLVKGMQEQQQMIAALQAKLDKVIAELTVLKNK